jgi:Txe/YoeB family toxin of toxin-antitoxin system
VPERPVTYHAQMLDDLTWFRDHDPWVGERAVKLIEQTAATPERGIGRPKRLHTLRNAWSRRITRHHRLHYLLLDDEVRFLSCRDHELPQHIYEALRAEEDV